MPESYLKPGLVVLGIGTVGGSVLYQLIHDNKLSSFESVDVGDSRHILHGLTTERDLNSILEAKACHQHLDTIDSLRGRLDSIKNLPKYFKRNGIVINALPTYFPNPGDLQEQEHDSIVYVKQALLGGAHVINATKSQFGDQEKHDGIMDAAFLGGARHYPTGAFMGPAKVAELLQEIIGSGSKIKSAVGVVNGTTNFMLTEMIYNGLDYNSALDMARSLGLADGDGKADTHGHDPLSKIRVPAILSRNYVSSPQELYGLNDESKSGLTHPHFELLQGEKILGIEGVTNSLLEALGKMSKTLKLVGSYNGQTGHVEVGPRVLSLDHPLANLKGTENMAIFNLEGRIDMLGILMSVFPEPTIEKLNGDGIERYRIENGFHMPGNNSHSKRDRYTIHLSYDPKENVFTVRAPGAGNGHTAHALLETAEGIGRNEYAIIRQARQAAKESRKNPQDAMP